MKIQNWENEFEKFGEIYTLPFGKCNEVIGLTVKSGFRMNAQCNTKPIKKFIEKLLFESQDDINRAIKVLSKIIENKPYSKITEDDKRISALYLEQHQRQQEANYVRSLLERIKFLEDKLNFPSGNNPKE